MEKDCLKIGKVTLTDADSGEVMKELAITDMVRSVFKDHRMCTIARTEENTFVLAIENPKSTGRNTLNQMHLTEESLLALTNSIFLYYMHNGIDINQKMKDLIDSDTIDYEYNNE